MFDIIKKLGDWYRKQKELSAKLPRWTGSVLTIPDADNCYPPPRGGLR